MDAEVVVQSVAIARCDGIGQVDVELAVLNGVPRGHRTVVLGGRHRIGAWVAHRDGLAGLACVPKVVRHIGLHTQFGRVLITEISSQRHNGNGSIHHCQMQGYGTVAAVLTLQELRYIHIRNSEGLDCCHIESMQIIGRTLTYNIFKINFINRMYRQLQGHNAVAAVGSIYPLEGMHAHRTQLLCGKVKAIGLIRKMLAAFIRKHGVGGRDHRQHQGHRTVATVHALQVVHTCNHRRFSGFFRCNVKTIFLIVRCK